MKTAKDLMTSKVFSIATTDSLEQVLELFRAHHLTTAPVLDSQKSAIGILTELALVKAFAFHQLKKGKTELMNGHLDMLTPVTSVKESATLTEIISKMLRCPTHRVLVVDCETQTKVVGIISPKDIINYINGDSRQVPNQDLIQNLNKTKSEVAKMTNGVSIIEHYQTEYDKTPIMMYALSSDGEILMANQLLHRTLGYESGKLIGQSIFEMFAEDDQKEVFRLIRDLKKHGGHHTSYLTCRGQGQSEVKVEIASAALNSKSGEFICTISAARTLDSDSVLGALMSVLGQEGRSSANSVTEAS
jgi:PAS domain S-box-containing protein